MATETKRRNDNRRISPRGMIDLPLEVRKALGFRKGESKLLDVQVKGKSLLIRPAEKPGPYTVKASPGGVFQLPAEAHQALTGGTKGRYDLDESKIASQTLQLRSRVK